MKKISVFNKLFLGSIILATSVTAFGEQGSISSSLIEPQELLTSQPKTIQQFNPRNTREAGIGTIANSIASSNIHAGAEMLQRGGWQNKPGGNLNKPGGWQNRPQGGWQNEDQALFSEIKKIISEIKQHLDMASLTQSKVSCEEVSNSQIHLSLKEYIKSLLIKIKGQEGLSSIEKAKISLLQSEHLNCALDDLDRQIMPEDRNIFANTSEIRNLFEIVN